jgi:MHS family proline/betaine transporter-like MFS transporter
VLGHLGDTHGRKNVLLICMFLMGFSTMAVGLLPTYHQIGMAAPALLVVLRLLQGFAVAGEISGASSMILEHAPFGRRGYYASFTLQGVQANTFVHGQPVAVAAHALTPQQMDAWGWRVPFLFGLLIGPVAWYIRSRLDETPEFLAAETTSTPLRDTFASQKVRLLIAMGAVVLGTVATYLVLFMPTYGVKQLGLSPSVSFAAIMLVGVIQLVLAPVFGHFSDVHGRTRLMLASAVLLFVLILPGFAWLVAHPGFGTLLVIEAVFGLLMTGYFASLPGLLSEIFPVQTRTTGMSLAYNVAVTIFGGFGPFIVTWLIETFDSPLAPTYYVMGGLAVSIVAVACVPAQRHADLDARRKPA